MSSSRCRPASRRKAHLRDLGFDQCQAQVRTGELQRNRRRPAARTDIDDPGIVWKMPGRDKRLDEEAVDRRVGAVGQVERGEVDLGVPGLEQPVIRLEPFHEAVAGSARQLSWRGG